MNRHHSPRTVRFISALIVCTMLIATTACSLSPTPFPLSVPTPDCGAPTLTIGPSTFTIQTIQPSSNNFLDVPPDSRKTAFWMDGTTANYVFVISPAADNLALESSFLDSVAGQTAKVTWTNCNSASYTLSAGQASSVADAKLPDQSSPGITLFFEKDASGTLVVVKGDASGEVITIPDTPAPGGVDIQAEISLGKIAASAGGKTVTISVSIRNTGTSSFNVSPNDILLVSQDGLSLAPTSSKPGLPRDIKPGATANIDLTFPRPASQTATLKIFDVEYDVEGY